MCLGACDQLTPWESWEVRGENRAQESRAKVSCSGMVRAVLSTLVVLISPSVKWAHNRGL